MNTTLFRQLKDIQLQAEKLNSREPAEEELTLFSNYNDELKNYILLHTNEPEIVKLAFEIPNVLDVTETKESKSLIALLILGLVTLGISFFYVSYVAGMRRTRLIQENIQIVRGKYASIEFLLKANQ